MSLTVYRYQDCEGRGPYRPGIQRLWMDDDHDQRNPTFVAEFGLRVLGKIPGRLKHIGCGFLRPGQADDWFTDGERRRIEALGYEFVRIEADLIAARSVRQILFACRKPFAELAEHIET